MRLQKTKKQSKDEQYEHKATVLSEDSLPKVQLECRKYNGNMENTEQELGKRLMRSTHPHKGPCEEDKEII